MSNISKGKKYFNAVAYLVCLLLGLLAAFHYIDFVSASILFLLNVAITIFYNYQYVEGKDTKPKELILYGRPKVNYYRNRTQEIQLSKKEEDTLNKLLVNPHYIEFQANQNFKYYDKEFMAFVLGLHNSHIRGKKELDMYLKSGFKPLPIAIKTKTGNGEEVYGKIIESSKYKDNGIGYLYREGVEDKEALLHYQANGPMILGKQIFFLTEYLSKSKELTSEEVESTNLTIAEYQERISKLDSLTEPMGIPALTTLRVYLNEAIKQAEYDQIVQRVYLFEKHIRCSFQILEINTQ